jgi:transposase
VSTPRCALAPEAPPAPLLRLPRRKPHSHSKNAPEGNSRAPILRLTGVALVAVPGRSDALAHTIRAKRGTDLRQGPTAQHVGSWLGLAPNNAISGGKGLKRRTRKNRHRAPHACRIAAQAVGRAPCAGGACSRRVQRRLGPAQALVATAHKRARIVYHRLQDRSPSQALGAAE